ncbi:hypothetical protein BpHYR1_029325 [Brachionus plicatilis]|uniref:Uncharacterized protein n=1 Tax=Brachionus plicatilis TaxID=10195 RepID=A0A3M7S676_BRAPC|nr:hypothetical protein BpHYR1_029325 [Brachionus plicatilis]
MKAKCFTQGKAFENEYQISFKENIDTEHTHGPKPTKYQLKEKRRKLKELTGACSKAVSSLAPEQILTSVLRTLKPLQICHPTMLIANKFNDIRKKIELIIDRNQKLSIIFTNL